MGYYKSPLGRNSIKGFSNEIIKRECQMRELSKVDRKSKTTNKSYKLFVKVNICWLCDNEYKNVVDEVKHYCKLSGNYSGAANQFFIDYVNRVNKQKTIPALYNNFSKYDNHIFFKNLINSKN